MSSRAMGSRLQDGRLDVDVLHGARDSFSRSVDRAACGYVRRVFPRDSWACTDASYAHTEHATSPGEWLSTVTFVRRPS